MNISGIYKIQSISNPKRCYIGSAKNISKRWVTHLIMLKNNKHHSIKLQNHFNKYGECDLQFSILLGCDTTYLIASEQFFIDSYRPWFNIAPKAGSQLGFKHSDETKEKMRAARLGTKVAYKKRWDPTDEWRKNLSISQSKRRERERIERVTA